jgi:hypothetical protein
MRQKAEERLALLKVMNRAMAGGQPYQELFKALLSSAKDPEQP